MIKINCIDDEPSSSQLCEFLNHHSHGRLNIVRRAPSNWEKEVAFLIEDISQGKGNGCLLDYRLDEKISLESGLKVPVSYTADSLIQELRRRSVEQEDTSFPVILWSNADRLDEFDQLDPNFRKNYDLVIDKELIDTSADSYVCQILSLAKGYSKVRPKKTRITSICDLMNPPSNALISSIDNYFKKKFHAGAHGYQTALYIIHETLNCEGPLIGREMVSAILGIDTNDSKIRLKIDSFLKKFRYTGVFSDGFERYWKTPLLANLNSLVKRSSSWIRLPAEERALALKTEFRVRTLPYTTPIQDDYSRAYDTICAFSRRPMNRMDGFALFEDDGRVWKEQRFISGNALRRNFKKRAKQFRLEEGEERRFLALYNAN